MISVVVVFNSKQVLNNILLPSLHEQSMEYEFIPIDNTTGRFKSASEALNYGGKQATGDYIMFVHQDVELDSGEWLGKAESALRDIANLGIAGVAGMSDESGTDKSRGRGYISDCGQIWEFSNKIERPEKVQTLDECLLIVPRSVFLKLQFDSTIFTHWHCYGADYCLSVHRIGLESYVIPLFIFHRSVRTNQNDLLKYQVRLFNKHKKNYRRIYTPSGELSPAKLVTRSIIEQLYPVYLWFFPHWTKQLMNEIRETDAVLDLGCGYNSPLQHCKFSYALGIELYTPYFEESKKKAIHTNCINSDVRDIDYEPKSFDVVLATDVLEHLTKEEGYELINRMEKWARRKIIITTPNGYVEQESYDGNLSQKHTSGWSASDLRELGFNLHGMSGWKKLRGHLSEIKYSPSFFWLRVSDISQWLAYYYPAMAFQLFAVKNVCSTEKTK